MRIGRIDNWTLPEIEYPRNSEKRVGHHSEEYGVSTIDSGHLPGVIQIINRPRKDGGHRSQRMDSSHLGEA